MNQTDPTKRTGDTQTTGATKITAVTRPASPSSPIALTVNGKRVAREVEPRTHLGDFLRDELRLTGTHLGCEHGVCGACTVLIDGQPVRSCITFAVACEGHSVTTIEGHDDDPVMPLLRSAFHARHALQCGYCTPGMLATARDIVLRLPDADEARVRLELSGNLCRCTGYMGIVAAILDVLAHCREAQDSRINALRALARTGSARSDDSPGGVTASAGAGSGATAGSATSAFTPFEAAAARGPEFAPEIAPPPLDAATDPSAASKGKGTRIDGTFDVAHPPDRVWAFMGDLAAVAACLPGASIDSHEADRVKGRIAIKFGPMSAAFVGAARLERDDAARAAVLRGAGQDSLSQSRAQGDVSYRLEALPDGSTRAQVELLYTLQGPLAQFSRSGLVRDFVRRMIADFGRNVGERMNLPAGAPASASAGASVAQQPPAQLNPVRTLLAILWDRLRKAIGLGR